jgi:hypothetical protein
MCTRRRCGATGGNLAALLAQRQLRQGVVHSASALEEAISPSTVKAISPYVSLSNVYQKPLGPDQEADQSSQCRDLVAGSRLTRLRQSRLGVAGAGLWRLSLATRGAIPQSA